MAKTDYQSIDEYHKAFSEEQQQRMQQIRAIIHELAPEADEVISYQIPAFKIGKQFLIYYSAYTKHISLSSPWTEALLSRFGEALKSYKVTKSAIQLPADRPFPEELIRQIVSFRKDELSGL